MPCYLTETKQSTGCSEHFWTVKNSKIQASASPVDTDTQDKVEGKTSSQVQCNTGTERTHIFWGLWLSVQVTTTIN